MAKNLAFLKNTRADMGLHTSNPLNGSTKTALLTCFLQVLSRSDDKNEIYEKIYERRVD